MTKYNPRYGPLDAGNMSPTANRKTCNGLKTYYTSEKVYKPTLKTGSTAESTQNCEFSPRLCNYTERQAIKHLMSVTIN